MAKSWYLDKYFPTGTDLQTGKRQMLVITRIGTDANSDVQIEIDNKPTMKIITDIAPLESNDNNTLEMLDLKDYYLVIPPETDFKFGNATGNWVHVQGIYLMLEPGEQPPSNYINRFKEQAYKFIWYEVQTVNLGVDTPFGAEDEVTLWSKQASVIERIQLNGVVMIKWSNATINYNSVGVLFYYDDIPFEYLEREPIREGIDINAFPYPPTANTKYYPFTLADLGLVLENQHKFEIRAKNISGADITPTAGTSLTFQTLVSGVYEKKR